MQREKWAKWKLQDSGCSGVEVAVEGADWVAGLNGIGGTILGAESGGEQRLALEIRGLTTE